MTGARRARAGPAPGVANTIAGGGLQPVKAIDRDVGDARRVLRLRLPQLGARDQFDGIPIHISEAPATPWTELNM